MSHADLIGQQAPSFSLPNQDGENFEFKPAEAAKPTALLFYPASGSYGCTQQACSFNTAVAEDMAFSPERVQIIGISPDSVAKQKQFVETNKLSFPVLSDPKKEAAHLYKIGRGMMGITPIARVTVIIDAKGVVRDTMDATMNYGVHQGFVAKWLKKLESETSEGQ
ncbi:thioredoxin-like protein [Coprinopsis sp. MPI-PUGE-AT-0042]|nr:thioredoxin-like protein [Coprinopsis sp. MPI-PUGE-AT-0042]